MVEPTIQAQPSATVAAPETTKRARLRIWPAVLLVAVMWLMRLYASTGEPAPSKFFLGLLIAPMAAMGGLVLWTLFASRLRWSDRLIMVLTLGAALGATILISGNNFPIMALVLFAAPVVATAWVGWLIVTARLNWPLRRNGVLAIFTAAAVICSMLRLDGMDGTFQSEFHWRWTPTPEQLMLTSLKSSQPAKPGSSVDQEDVEELVAQADDWPAFRGRDRSGRLSGIRINTAWEKSPPKELWRHRIGPGWSSMTVVGKHVFTQEQRGDEEYVVCYDGETGSEIWNHHDATRFNEVVAGPGPRATPTFDEGKLYVLGANGALNCLNAANGKLIWTRNIAKDTEAKVPQWGFSSSPLVTNGLVIVFAGGPEDKSVVAYHTDSGEPAWTAGKGSLSYCSPQLNTVDGVEQVLINTDAGMFAFEPQTGKVLWNHAWESTGTARVVQPLQVGDQDLLIGTGMGFGTRRIHVTHSGDEWQTKEVWTTRDFKPYYNDLVMSGDYLYGFDGNIFMCISLADGSRKWRARGYGNGQVLLLADQQLLLIISETGDVALVDAKPDRHNEIARFKAIEGKTWNHPVVSQGKLYVRNGEEIACFQLTVSDKINESERLADQSNERLLRVR